MASKYMCATCGLPVRLAKGKEGAMKNAWQHCGNGSRISCGKLPEVVERTKHTARLQAARRMAYDISKKK